MIGRYLGHLSLEDPLYGYLQEMTAAGLGSHRPDARYRVYEFVHSRDVYLYERKHDSVRVVGKFIKSKLNSRPPETEFHNLKFLRDLGFNRPPHHVVRPLGYNPAINNVLVLECMQGELLSKVILDAIYENKRNRLFRKLTGLADFLAAMHNRTAGDLPVDFRPAYEYMGRILNSLTGKWGLHPGRADWFYHLREAWRNQGRMWEDRSVLVHGDPTPSNLLFGHGREVMIIDLERMKWADRVFDLGRLCGELKHFFFRALGDPFAAEPFIGHFLWEYCGRFPDRMSAFYSVTRRLPFYMGITLLRIARNSWIDPDYRLRLIDEAEQTLKAVQ